VASSAHSWSVGSRRPDLITWTVSIGALLSGDAGQNDLEEVDQITRGGNYG
jgi:glucose/arabinose dehydrogenase